MAIGIYLPFELSVPILLGGIVAWFVQRAQRRGDWGSGEAAEAARKEIEQRGMLISSGLTTGEALVGIGMAVPIYSDRGAFRRAGGVRDLVWPGVVLVLALIYGIYKASVPRRV